MGLGSSLKKLSSGKGNWLANFGATISDLYNAPGDDTAKMLPSRYRNAYRRNVRNALLVTTGNAAGGIFEKSKSKGYTDKEASQNAVMLGAGHSQVSAKAKARMEAEEQAVQYAELERKRIAEDTRARGQIAARIRRSARATRNDKGGTLLTGGLGTTGSNAGAFAAMLGL
jgi:hypothetical protein